MSYAKRILPDVINQVIKGACNRDQLQKRFQGKKCMMAMTQELMLKLKHNLANCCMRKSKKRIIWSVATLCWGAALRIHEALSCDLRSYDPLTTLLATDITVCDVLVGSRVIEALKINIKHPKEECLSARVVIDVFATNNFMCPVKAFKDWHKDKIVILSNQKPMYRLADG